MTARRSAPRDIPGADRPGTRRALWASAAGFTMALTVGLTGCADSAALGLVHQACHDVDRSLSLYRAAQREPDATRAAQERARAQAQLQAASPLASEAAGEAPQWQALMATLAENSRLPESSLVPALQAQCAAVETGGIMVPTSPSTTLPATPETPQ